MKKIIFIFIILIGIQLVYSFLFPSYDIYNPYWKRVEELDSFKGYLFDSFDNSIVKRFYPLISNYHINSDCAGQILLAHDFPQHYFRGHVAFLNRPLYAFSVYLISRPLHLISNSYSLTFLAGIFLNFILFLCTVYLFYLFVTKIVSNRVAFLSSFLLIFSPFTHIWLTQPTTEIFGVFFVIFSIYLIYNYATQSSYKKLIIFSLIIGVLMLGKMLFSISLFILILALYFRRYKEGILFVIIHLVPIGLWYLLVTRIFGLNYYSADITVFKMYTINNWLLNIFQLPWNETLQILFSALPRFISSLIYGFLLFPVIFAPIGFKKLQLKRKNILCLSLIFAFFFLFFIMNYYIPRHGFLLFPIIYPLAVLGIDETANFLKKYKKCYSRVFYSLIYIVLLVISSLNIYQFISYG